MTTMVAGLCLLGGLGIRGAVAAGTTTPPSSLLTGAYVGAADPSGLSAFDAATGTHSSIAVDYLAYNRGWDGMDGANGSDAWLFQDAWSNSGRQLSLGVPIIPSDSSGNPVGTLAEGASGAYNSYFVTLAQTMVAAGESNAYLRLGWEFDGNWYAWNATNPTDEANFAAYFRQIVTAMRSVAGENFKFVWNPDADTFTNSGYNVALAYPGSAYVDVIGLDAYDQVWVSPQTPANAWNQAIGPELNAAHAFAASQGRPLALTEWGSIIRSDGHGLGDDPTYINNMIAWMKNPANDVIFETYFDFNAGGLDSFLTDGEFPNSLAAFSSDLQTTTTSPATTTTDTSTTTTPTTTTDPSTTTTPTTMPTTEPGSGPYPNASDAAAAQFVCSTIDRLDIDQPGFDPSVVAVRVEALLSKSSESPLASAAQSLEVAIEGSNEAGMTEILGQLQGSVCPSIEESS